MGTKERIAETLSLTLSWLITGTGFPFQTGEIVHLKPSPKYFMDSFQLINIAITNSSGGKAIHVVLDQNEKYFFLYLMVGDSVGSIVSILTPTGHEELLYRLIKIYTAILYLGIVGSIDSEYTNQYKTSFEFVLSRLNHYKAKVRAKSRILMPEDFFCLNLFNTSKEDMKRLIYKAGQTSTAQNDKIEEFIMRYQHHHNKFKEILKKWIREEPFLKEDLATIEEFTRKVKLSDILHPDPEKFSWEAGSMKDIEIGVFVIFEMAYKELVKLIFIQGQGMKVVRPKIDDASEKIYWDVF
jgi:hypothetical protein